MDPKAVFPIIVVSLAWMCLCRCSPTNSAPAQSIQSVAFADDEIPGWSVDPSDTSGFGRYRLIQGADTQAMFNLIDGGATEYLTRAPGFSSFLREEMVDSARFLTLYIVDYSSSANAATMFDFVKSTWADTEALSGFLPSVAMSDTSRDANIYACAHFGRFFLEFRFEGYAERAGSIRDATAFLAAAEKKIK